MKKCQFCAEKIQDEAVKCRFCGELLNQTESKANKYFAKYEEWLKQNYPMYQIVSINDKENFIVLNKDYKPFNIIIFIVLLLLWVLPGLIYALATLTGKKIISLTVYFNDDGSVKKIDGKNFDFLRHKYNKAQGFKDTKPDGKTEKQKETSEKEDNILTRHFKVDKKLLKFLGWGVLIVLGILYWYIVLPAIAIWYFLKKTNLSKKTKIQIFIIAVLLLFIVMLIIGYSNPVSEITINESADNVSTQEKTIEIKDMVIPQQVKKTSFYKTEEKDLRVIIDEERDVDMLSVRYALQRLIDKPIYDYPFYAMQDPGSDNYIGVVVIENPFSNTPTEALFLVPYKAFNQTKQSDLEKSIKAINGTATQLNINLKFAKGYDYLEVMEWIK